MDMEFDVFLSISQTPDSSGYMPDEQTMMRNYFDQVQAADKLGYGIAWIAQAHLSTETQKTNLNPVVPHFPGEIGLCTDFFQLAGATFSLYTKYGWSEGHTTNYGWIVLAIVIFGGWNPYRAAAGAYSFGLLQVLAIKAQSVTLALSQILPLLPFPLMIFILIFIQYINRKERSSIPKIIISLVGGNQPEALGKKLPEEIK